MPGDEFKVFMFANDFDRIRTWVLRYPDSETGGDLFGLWTNPGRDAVLHVILGPGRECTHGQYHFYQDINYLSSVGELLTNNFMLCHIGEWHSHHKLKLCKPSEGDCSTVIRNFPKGACGFLLLIANITSETNISVSPYLFKERSHTYKAGNVQILETIESPFRLIPKVGKALRDGKEVYKPTDKYGRGPEEKPARGSETQSQRTQSQGGPKHGTTHSDEQASCDNQQERCPQQTYAIIEQQQCQDNSKPAQTAERRTKDGQEVYKPVDKYGRSVEERLARGTSETHSQRSGGSKHETPHSDEQGMNSGTQEERPQKTYADASKPILPSQTGERRTQIQSVNEKEGRETTASVEQPRRNAMPNQKQTNTASTAVELDGCTRIYQWYTNKEMWAFLKEVQEGLRSLSDGLEEVKIQREPHYQQDLALRFRHHGSTFLLDFKFNFPYSFAELSTEKYFGQNKSKNLVSFISGTRTSKDFVAEIKAKVITNCQCCPKVTYYYVTSLP